MMMMMQPRLHFSKSGKWLHVEPCFLNLFFIYFCPSPSLLPRLCWQEWRETVKFSKRKQLHLARVEVTVLKRKKDFSLFHTWARKVSQRTSCRPATGMHSGMTIMTFPHTKRQFGQKYSAMLCVLTAGSLQSGCLWVRKIRNALFGFWMDTLFLWGLTPGEKQRHFCLLGSFWRGLVKPCRKRNRQKQMSW